jgi:hypothetical protein
MSNYRGIILIALAFCLLITFEFLAKTVKYKLLAKAFANEVNLSPTQAKPNQVAIVQSDTFSKENGKWKMDTFINYNIEKRRLDTMFYLKKI